MEKDTMAYQLAVLRDTQMVQRRQLEAMYPYIDWSKMPFSSYGDFFRLRSIIEECGEVWTNAYGRSNEEADSTRKYLKDYSGKGRDIELFNFGYSKQSGFNGYVQDFRKTNHANVSGSVTESRVDVTNISESASNQWIVWMNKSNYVNKAWEAYVEYDGSSALLVFYNSDFVTIKAVGLQSGAINKIPALTDDVWSQITTMAFSVPKGAHLTLTQIPDYRGALVGDGVDDYGVCTQGFALPSDYTVVAMREYISSVYALLAYKAAFSFELGNVVCQSYSAITTLDLSKKPVLFSYQTKSSYNGNDINVGSSGDSDATKLMLFKRQSDAACANTALYSFGVFSRTLTADELRTVENCMYAEWICMTGQLDGIEYYDILDARFRSNDESEDKRNKWVGRFGRLHMTLHNYAFAEGSGWSEGPDYPGALVSDGVDDYAVSDEVIDDEIGGVVCHVGYLDNTLAYTYGLAVVGSVQNNRLYLQRAQSGTVYIGHPLRAYAGAFPLLLALDRTPVAPAAKLYVGGSENARGKCALYQLRLIKTQPTDIQLEAIKWQCRKEHEDYLIHRGWKEIG